MKLVRYGRAGAEKPGLIDAEGKLRDLSRVVRDITPETLTPAGLKRLRAAKPSQTPVVKGKPRLGCPLAGIGKIVCIGLNYTDHAVEVKMALPKEPTIFIKANSAISGPGDPIARPRGAVGPLVFYVGRFRAVRPGALLSTGPPAGVGHGARPPRYLDDGDVVAMGIDGLGTQQHRVVAPRS